MPESNDRSSEVSTLSDFHRKVEALHQHILASYLQPYQLPKWDKSEGYTPSLGRFGKRLNWVFFDIGRSSDVLPTGMLLPIMLILCISFEAIYPMLFADSMYDIIFRAIKNGIALKPIILFVGLLLIIGLTLVYASIGGYWTTWETLRNGGLSWKFKSAFVLVIVAAILFWIFSNQPLASDQQIFKVLSQDDPLLPISKEATVIQQSPIYRVCIAILLYIPALCHYSLWLSSGFLLFVTSIRGLIYWVFHINDTTELERIRQLVFEDIKLGENISFSLSKLDHEQISNIRDWSLLRRQIIQSRLIPTTLILGGLGLFANTDVGQGAMSFFIDEIRFLISPPIIEGTFFDGLILTYRSMFVAVLIVIPFGLVGRLLNKAYSMDVLSEACSLALLLTPAPAENAPSAGHQILEFAFELLRMVASAIRRIRHR